METSKGDMMYDLVQRLEQRIIALEKEVQMLKNGKCPENTKSRQLPKMIPLDDYETFIEKLTAKNSNIEEIIKIYDETNGIKTKKLKLIRFQNWLQNMILSSVYTEKEIIPPIRFASTQLYKYSHSDNWIPLQFHHFVNHLKTIIKQILKELTKWSELSCEKYTTENRDMIFISITDLLTVSYNEDDFEKIVKTIVKKIH